MITIWPGHVGANQGAHNGDRAEERITDDIAAAVYRAAARRDVPAAVLGAGSYEQRAAYADLLGGLVLHLHLDEGGPALYHYGSAAGQAAASRLAAALSPVLPLRVREATETGYPRARALLARTRAPAVLLELADIRDTTGVSELLARLDLIGEAIVVGAVDGG